MDDFRQSAAPTARRRRSASGRRLLGLLAVLALVLLLPGGAFADAIGEPALEPVPPVIETVIPSDPVVAPSESAPAPSEAAPAPSEPAPTASDPAHAASEPSPAPSDPAPAASEPAPAPSDPAPAPSEPAPAPVDPAPAPSEPAPGPSEPAPGPSEPSDPVPPADEVPADPAPAPSEPEPAPADPAPRDGRATAPKPPTSEERQEPAADQAVFVPVTAPAPAATVPSTNADADPARAPEATDDEAAHRQQEKVVRAAYKRLGLGTIAAPAPVDPVAPATAAPAQACTPIGTVVTTADPQGGAVLATRTTVRTHRAQDEQPLVRGPPAPLESPSAPVATPASGGPATGGVSGERDCAILADHVAFTLADGGSPAAAERCDHVAPAPANVAARAPPVV